MKRNITCVWSCFAVFAALGAFAATEAERAAARAELVEGVVSIDAPGGALPGGYVLIGDDVFPIAECRNYDGTTAFASVGAFYGQGRAVMLAHPNYLCSSDFQRDTKRLLENAVKWGAKGKAAPKVAVLREAAVENTVKALGCKDVTRVQDAAALDGYDVAFVNNVRKEEIPSVLAFVEKGGGLVESSLGWGFMYFNPNACFAEDFVDNRLTGALGALVGNMGVNRMPSGGFTTQIGEIRKGTTVDEAIQLAVAGELGDRNVRQQVAKTLTELMNGLPSGVRPGVYEKLLAIADRPEAKVQPSPERPLGAESMFARLAILARKNAWLSDPEKVWPADPAASVYPGLVKPGTPSVTREIAVDLKIPRWHSTGIFSPAGQALTVKIPESAAKLGLKVRIGSTADDLSGSGEWKRFPLVTVDLPLTKAETTFASPFGGLVYIVVPDGITSTSSLHLTLSGGVMAPWFKLGRDTNEKFAKECAETGAPWGEIEADGFIITSETRGLKRVPDPTWIAAFWDKVMKADLELAGWTERRSPERICSDVQLTCGWLHDGYPLMSHVNEEHFDWAIDQEGLESGDGWGVYHEIGHNHQSRDWTPEGTGEVTVNLFTMYALETVAGADLRSMRYPCGTQHSRHRVENWVKRGKKFDDWKGDYFLALEMYLRIKEAYGWDAYKKTFARYRQPGAKHPRKNDEIWNTFACELSTTVNADMAAVLTAWSIPLSDEAKRFCAKFPAAKASLTAGLEKKPYVSPATEPVAGEYMSVALAGEDVGEIEMIPTRSEIPGGEQDRRWKTTHLLLRRIEPTTGPVRLGNLDGPTNCYEAAHEVEITRPYYIGVYELTQEQYFRVMGSWRDGCWGGKGDRETRPVNGISYDNARGSEGDGINWPATGRQVAPNSIVGRLRELAGFRAEFDLPTEAQWEYAGRAGTTGDWNNGEKGEEYQDKKTKQPRDTNADRLARYCGNGGESVKPNDPLMRPGVKTPYGTAEVGSYAPNAWGLYDFHGNVYEHCLDYLRPYPDALADYSGKDPVGPKDCGVNKEGRKNDARRVMRGGTWWNPGFGHFNNAKIWNRGLGAHCGTGTGHGATGLRICVDASVAPQTMPGPDAEVLSPEAMRARTQLVKGVCACDSKGLPGPVYCLSPNAFPVVAARTWDGQPAALVAAAAFGKGRVVVIADDTVDETLADNARLLRNAEKWVTDGSKTLGLFRREVKRFDLASLPEDEDACGKRIAEIAADVAGGAGYVFCGRAWPWRQKTLSATGKCRVSDWPGNRLLAKFGLIVGDFCVKRTSGESGWTCRNQPEAGASVAPSELFDVKKAERSAEPVIRPLKEKRHDGSLVKDGETIAFLGDSITRLGAEEKGYINLVLAGLEVAGVRNVGKVPAGIDGQHAGDMLGRIGGLIANPDVKVITISCGVNDVWGFDWARGLQLEEYALYVRKMYDKAAAAGVQVIAMTPTLIREEPDNEYNRILDTFADFIRAEAKRRGLPLADCRQAEIEGLKSLPPDSGKFYTYDGVHPVWEGNRLIARELLKAMGVWEKHGKNIEAKWQEMGGRYDLKVYPCDPCFDNVGGWTSLRAFLDAGPFQRGMLQGLRTGRHWALRLRLTDETTENVRDFHQQVGDMLLDANSPLAFPLARHGFVPTVGHAYTAEFTVLEQGNVRAEGCSAKGAFKVREDGTFMREGRRNTEIKIRRRQENPLYWKSVLFLGDGLVAASCERREPELSYTAGFPGRVGWANAMRWMNRGRDGATVASAARNDTVVRQLEDSRDTPFDFVLLSGGFADAMAGVETGALAEGDAKNYHMPKDPEKRFASALERTLWMAKNAFPKAKLGFIVNPRVDPAACKEAYARYDALVPLIRTACEKWGVACLDLWNDASLTERLKPGTRTASGDGLLPNSQGYDMIAPYVEAFLEALESGAAREGALFRPSVAAYADPNPDVVAAGDVNVAAGKPAYAPICGWTTALTDGRKDALVTSGAGYKVWSDRAISSAYVEIDLGGLYTIDKVRLFPPVANALSHYMVFVSDDDRRTPNDWRMVWWKKTNDMPTPRGHSGMFDPVDAKYVRIYFAYEQAPRGGALVEAEVFGKPSEKAKPEQQFFRKDQPAPRIP